MRRSAYSPRTRGWGEVSEETTVISAISEETDEYYSVTVSYKVIVEDGAYG